jgi:hypothetical protein
VLVIGVKGLPDFWNIFGRSGTFCTRRAMLSRHMAGRRSSWQASVWVGGVCEGGGGQPRRQVPTLPTGEPAISAGLAVFRQRGVYAAWKHTGRTPRGSAAGKWVAPQKMTHSEF